MVFWRDLVFRKFETVHGTVVESRQHGHQSVIIMHLSEALRDFNELDESFHAVSDLFFGDDQRADPSRDHVEAIDHRADMRRAVVGLGLGPGLTEEFRWLNIEG